MNFFQKDKLSEGDTYGVQTGQYVGEMWVFVEKSKDLLKFLSVPKMVNREVTKEKFDTGKELDIIEFVEKVPKNLFRVIKKQFQENRNSENTKSI